MGVESGNVKQGKKEISAARERQHDQPSASGKDAGGGRGER